MAGTFRLCYTDSGSWSSGAQLVPSADAQILVHGALPWSTVTPMRTKKFVCFAGGIPGTNCKVRLEGVVGNNTAAGDWTRFNRLTWALTFSWDDTCGTGVALPSIGVGRADSPFLLSGANGLEFDLGYTTTPFESKTFWVCYCPSFDADGNNVCTNAADFLQVVGKLIVFSLTQSVATIVPVTSFDVTVACGSVSGCANTLHNRIRVVKPTSWQAVYNRNNFPNWHVLSGCHSAPQTVHYLAPPNCVSPNDCSALMNGGDHVDYKVFKRLKMDNFISAGLTLDREFDVCFCDGMCHIGTNWWKVGVITVLKAYVVSASDFAFGDLNVIGTPGLLSLGTKVRAYPDNRGGVTNSFATNAHIKLLPDNDQEISDRDCATMLPPSYFRNHGCVDATSCYPRSWKNDSTQIVTFNAKFYYGGLPGQAFQDDPLVQDRELAVTSLQSGIHAVCYCEGDCSETTSWAKLVRLEIRGPLLSQHWAYQTMIPFDLTLRGWGLRATNAIKIIDGALRCDSPQAVNWHRLHVRGKAVPAFNASVLRHDSALWKLAGYTQGNPIVDITDFFGQGSLLHFAHPAQRTGGRDVIKAKDVLVIENLEIQTDGRFPYTNPATADHVEIMSVSLGHRLVGPKSDDKTEKLFVIPAKPRHADGTVPTWSGTMRAGWTRTSEEMYSAVESTEARTGLRVCWSDSGFAPGDFTAEAGVLDLEDAPLMAYSSASLVATAAGTAAPLVIAFGTSLASGSRYRTAENTMMLRIALADPHVVPRASDLEGTELTLDPVHNDYGRETQVVCSRLFRELWSSHVNGFPIPKGCYYRHDERLYVIVFDPKNGLAEDSAYQIVMNVMTSPAPGGSDYWEKTPVVRLWSMDDVVTRREFAVEVGACHLRSGRFPIAAASGTAASRLGAEGLSVFGGPQNADEWVDLSAEDPSTKGFGKLSFTLRSRLGATIHAGSTLRLFLSPLTAWRLGPTCSASCAHEDPQLHCDRAEVSEISCAPASLLDHDGAQRNVLRLKLPFAMSPANDSSGLRIELPRLSLPAGGFFPERLYAELTGTSDTEPDFARSVGKLLYAPPGIAFAGVVNAFLGDGNDKPFRDDRKNTLYVRLLLGTSLRSQPPAVDFNRTASFTVWLPREYASAEATAVPDTLQVFGSDSPQGRGSLPSFSETTASLGKWTLALNYLRFDLAPGAAIAAGSAMMFRFVVDNPPYALPTWDPRNAWAVDLESFGEARQALSPAKPPRRPFQGGKGPYRNNVAVEGKLRSSLAPLVLTPGSRTNELYVYFETEQGVGMRAQVLLLGPRAEPYDFGKLCEPRMLPERYYSDVSPRQSTYPLPGMNRQVSCSGLQSSVRPSRYYGALIRLSGRLRPRRRYAFAILVKNPPAFEIGLTQEWYIKTRTFSEAPVDGSPGTVPLNPRQTTPRSFGLYKHQPPQQGEAAFVLNFASSLPTTIVRATTWLALGGVRFPTDSTCLFRFIAPARYQWLYAANEFLYRPSEVLPLLPAGGRLSNGQALVDEDLPVGFIAAPIVEPLNAIEALAPGNFREGRLYGLAAKVIVPSRPNTDSIDAFYLQCSPGETTLNNRPLAAILHAPSVAAVVDASVAYRTNILASKNRLRFSLRTSVDIKATGALVIKGPPGFRPESSVCTALATIEGVDEELRRARVDLVEYEKLIQQEEALVNAGTPLPQLATLWAHKEETFQALKATLTRVVANRRGARALPLETGCKYDADDQGHPFVEITLQVGAPNLLVDARIGSFVRTHLKSEQAYRSLEATLPAGLYTFELEVTNPLELRGSPVRPVPPEEDGATVVAAAASDAGVVTEQPAAPVGCGVQECWEVAAYAAPFSQKVPSERAAISKGFAVVDAMAEAFVVDLTFDQRLSTDRNDRPGEQNQLVFCFNLTRTSVEPIVHEPGILPVTSQELVLRAPHGYLFPDDCTVHTSFDEVFGRADLWPANLNISAWPSTTLTCDGLGNVAVVYVVGGAVALETNRRYAFRIDVLANPVTTPWYNKWALEFYGHRVNGSRHGEASTPFQGFEIWTLSDVRVIAKTTERSTLYTTTSAQSNALGNVLTILFTPFNAIPAKGGFLRVRAPDDFTWTDASALQGSSIPASSSVLEFFGSSEAGNCNGILRERPAALPEAAIDVMQAGSLGVSFWQTLPATGCFVDPIFRNVLVLQLSEGSGIKSKVEYALIAGIQNPNVEMTQPGTFELSTYRPQEQSAAGVQMDLADIVVVSGFPITKGLQSFAMDVPNGNGGAAGGVDASSATSAAGGSLSVARLRAAFVEPIFPGDVLVLSVPPGYDLQALSIAEPADGGMVALPKMCLPLQNRVKPGVSANQALKCFSGLECDLEVAGREFLGASQVQLNRIDRYCGDPAGRNIDMRRTRAEPSESSVSRTFRLGAGILVGAYRVCYCHGDGGCEAHNRFCQEAGILNVEDLCADANALGSCPPAPGPCQSTCDPRTGQCLAAGSGAMDLPDGSSCSIAGANATSRAGVCREGACVEAPEPSASTAAEEEGNDEDDSGTSEMPSSLSSALLPPSCIFDAFSCDARRLRWTVGHSGYDRFYELHLDVTMKHPVKTPVEDNVFVLSQERSGLIRGSRVISAYGIRSQFRSLGIALVGERRAGGSFSTLEFRFTTVRPATSLWVRAKEPIGYDFAAAAVRSDASFEILSALGDTIELAGSIPAATPIVLFIDRVLLPASGGRTFLDVVTYNDGDLGDSAYSAEVFQIPVHVEVSEVTLLNQFKRDTSGDLRVEASFGNRFGEWAQLGLRLRFSAELPRGVRLRISADSWRFSPLSAQLLHSQAVEVTSTKLDSSLSSDMKIQEDGSADVLELIIDATLKSKVLDSYLLLVEVFSPIAPSCFCWQRQACSPCEEVWTVEAFAPDVGDAAASGSERAASSSKATVSTNGDAGITEWAALPLASNDATLVGFPLVSRLDWSIFVPRSPPRADIVLTMRLTRVGEVPATLLIVTAPTGYRFSAGCLAANSRGIGDQGPDGSGDNASSSSSPAADGDDVVATSGEELPVFESCVGRLNVAILRLDEGGLSQPISVSVLAQTPHTTPRDNRWYIEGRRAKGNAQVAWGVTLGPEITSLQRVSVDYAQFENARTYFLFDFSVEVGVNSGGFAAVMPPRGYLLTCDGFIPFALPGYSPTAANGQTSRQATSTSQKESCTPEREGIRIYFPQRLRTQVEYGFMILAHTAPAVEDTREPVERGDMFSMRILDMNNRVVEATYEVPSIRLRSFGAVQAPDLLWYPPPTSGAKIWVTVALRVPQKAPPGLKGIAVQLPEGVTHAATSMSKERSPTGVTVAWRPVELRKVIPGIFGDFEEWRKDAAAQQSLGSALAGGLEPGDVLTATAAANATGVQPSSGSGPASSGKPLAASAEEVVRLPVLEDERRWLDLGRQGEVVIRFQPDAMFPACEIMVQLPVQLPNTLPARNAFRLRLLLDEDAGPAGSASASDVGDDDSRGGFVLPGFQFNEAPAAAVELNAEHLFRDNGLNYFEFRAADISGATRAPAAERACHVALSLLPLLLLHRLRCP
eukprot:TRINITY_DN10167_c0_g3_i1.p1 TRINITY_DN10167_c0_g3~~TRINITY_DN10167_c0_g3_i1.p1  ORF type:complete len:3827 (+),score=701.08 TRINITY_DN10167_c0_g3_i1:895-11481(+)